MNPTALTTAPRGITFVSAGLARLSRANTIGHWLFVVAFCVGLAACGGGGSATTSTTGSTGSTATSAAATSSGSVGAPIAALSGTETYTLLYAGTEVGTDARNATATFNTDNAMTAYRASASEALSLGSNSIAEKAGVPQANIGRWNGGTVSGSFYGTSAVEKMSLSGNQGFHYALAVKPTWSALPTNCSMTYSMFYSTNPTRGDGGVAPGTADSGSVTVSFGAAATTPTFSVTLTYTLDGKASGFARSGALTSFNVASDVYSMISNSSSESQIIYMAFAGATPTNLAFAYHRYPIPGSGGSASSVSMTGYMSRMFSSCP